MGPQPVSGRKLIVTRSQCDTQKKSKLLETFVVVLTDGNFISVKYNDKNVGLGIFLHFIFYLIFLLKVILYCILQKHHSAMKWDLRKIYGALHAGSLESNVLDEH